MRAITWARIMELRLCQDVNVHGVDVDEIAGMTEGLIQELCWNESRLLTFLELSQREEEWTDDEMRYAVRVLTTDKYGEGERIMDQVRDWIMREVREIVRYMPKPEKGDRDVEF